MTTWATRNGLPSRPTGPWTRTWAAPGGAAHVIQSWWVRQLTRATAGTARAPETRVAKSDAAAMAA
jgi:hypothetical protein